MREFLFFDNMLTPKFIVGIYWLLLLMVALSGLGIIFGMVPGFGFFHGLLILVVGALLTRVYCEVMIVLFKMNEALQEIRKK